MDRVDQDRRLRGVGFAIGRRVRQVLRQQPSGLVDRGLHELRVGALVLKSNCRVIEVEPSPLVEDMNERPGIAVNSSSSGVATVSAIVTGLAPGNCADTEIVGNCTLGSAETGSSS